VCKKYNLWLIEDCCDALGSKYDDQNVGTFGDIGTLSFYPAHHITMGEGGAVFTNSLKLRKIAESFRDWGRDCYCAPGCDNTCGRRFQWQLGDLPMGYDHKYIYSHMGFNLKITDMQAACGLAQLEKLERFVSLRKKNYSFLKELLADLDDFLILPEATASSEPSWFGFPLTLRDSDSARRRELLMFLDERLIGTRLLFAGNIIKQPYMSGKRFRVVGELKNTDKTMNGTFWVGVHPSLTYEMLDYISSSLFDFFSKGKKYI
jgi:CDP-6-deoxy-D-xylo-4-hexulose-3-dehydrase